MQTSDLEIDLRELGSRPGDAGLRERLADHGLRHFADPGPGGVDQDARGGDLAAAAPVEHQLPVLAALDADAACMRANIGAPFDGIHGGEHHQA